jgi:hypothetical protein
LVACTRKVPSSTGDRDLQQAAFSQLNEGTFSSLLRPPQHSQNPRASWPVVGL